MKFLIYIEFSEDLHIDTDTYHILFQKALIFKFKTYVLLLFSEHSSKRGN